ncbi:MAG: helix-turn-helix domain-containing protein [Lachnospiraceae bacterium]|nr:helix-turn-helix domain-containing protein [Lachnospiraceae bacterium]
MDIGSKIKKSRMEANLTQEQAAEALGISRQTISNWENEKSYPDIISVLKMSDLYSVSLDYLLKGEQTMSDYRDYLEESTNVVKSKTKLSKTVLISSYLVIWAVAILVFWVFISGSDAMGYSLMFLWGILPITTFVISLLIGKNDHWGKYKWFAALVFGFMYMLSEYLTFSVANNVSSDKVNVPRLSLLIVGILISLAGLGIGCLINKKKCL